MTINFKLGLAKTQDPSTDPMQRTLIGWDSETSAEENFSRNRGVWALGQASRRENLATYSFGGKVVMVAEIDGFEFIPSLDGTTPKQAVIGRVLSAGDDRYDSLIGTQVDTHRNPVTYQRSDAGACGCGCGATVTGNRSFLPGHDQRAIHSRITETWGSAIEFVRWYDSEHGRPPAAV